MARIKDVQALFRLWHDDSLSVRDIADTLSVSESCVYATAKRFQLAKREHREPEETADETEVNPDVDLRLAPDTEVKAAVIRARWTPEERYQRRVQKVMPVTYGRLDCP